MRSSIPIEVHCYRAIVRIVLHGSNPRPLEAPFPFSILNPNAVNVVQATIDILLDYHEGSSNSWDRIEGVGVLGRGVLYGVQNLSRHRVSILPDDGSDVLCGGGLSRPACIEGGFRDHIPKLNLVDELEGEVSII